MVKKAMVSKKLELMYEKLTHLAEKRTELAQERTINAYVRTAATVILFGMAFVGFSGEQGAFFLYGGWIAIFVGFGFIVQSIKQSVKHSKDLARIKRFFARLIEFEFKR